MYKGKTFLAIIPARSGSKRLPNKNILPLNNKPLIAWSIIAAKNSKYIDNIVVSSDSDKILKIAQKYNVKILKRPDYLATDTATTTDVIKHILKYFQNYDYLILLQPTSPLRNEQHIDRAIKLLEEKKACAIISVCETDYSPLWSNTLPQDLNMENFLRDEIKNKRNQDLPKYYKLNGAIYICKTDKFLEQNTLFINKNIFAYIMDKKSSVDIDDEIDFKLAEILIKNNHQK